MKVNISKTFIIAEAGVNHNGSLKKALKLIDAAAAAGANAIKFQTFNAENLVTDYAPKAEYQKYKSLKKETQFQMLKKLEFTKEMHKTCFKKCKKKKIIFISSAFDIENLNYLKKFKLSYFKVPSGEITNIPYLEVLGKFRKKIILSTGMSSIIEIKNAVKILIRNGTKKNNITLMQCTSAYPAPYDEINLNTIATLRSIFKLNIGFSDHSLGMQASIAAVALGAKVIEKHLTLSKKLKGPDHRASLDPKEFKFMVQSIRIVEKTLGNKIKKITKSEKKNIYIVRKSIVALTKIKKNERFSNLNITCKRPGTGISPLFFKKLIGKKSVKNFNKNDLIRLK
jgi:N,N'-diacetyllegionaminate synthase